MTLSEAKARGLGIRNEPPAPYRCEYCGFVVEPEGIILGNEVFRWRDVTRCKCPEAQKQWEEYDKKQSVLEQEKREEEEREERQRRIDRLLGSSGIKKRFMQRTFENFQRDTPGRSYSYKAAKFYADNWDKIKDSGKGLYFEGTNGTGKTHLAAAIALQLIENGVPVICKTGADILQDVKRAYDNPEVKEQQILDIYKNTDLLIIDDLGKEQCSEWSMTTLYSIINDRYESMKPIIITTNYNTEELAGALSPRGSDSMKIDAILSRLRETSTVITMAWDDIRGTGKY